MTWKVVQACSPGTSHAERSEPCQDCCLAGDFADRDGREYLLCLAADGAGSASLGRQGAETACEEGFRVIEDWLRKERKSKPITREDVMEWVARIRLEIECLAETDNRRLREYACTILGVLVDDRQAVFFQIGDGAIVVDEADGFAPVFWPDSGEYINETHFITQEDFLDHLHIRVEESLPREITLLTDGLQRLALVYKTRSAHNPFFESLMSAVRKADPESCDRLSEMLIQYLNSPPVNERTEDDKTLVLATRRSE